MEFGSYTGRTTNRILVIVCTWDHHLHKNRLCPFFKLTMSLWYFVIELQIFIYASSPIWGYDRNLMVWLIKSKCFLVQFMACYLGFQARNTITYWLVQWEKINFCRWFGAVVMKYLEQKMLYNYDCSVCETWCICFLRAIRGDFKVKLELHLHV